MKLTTSRFLIAILAFALGTMASWIARQRSAVAPAEVTQNKVQSAISNLIETTKVYSGQERFALLGHACGNGWAQGYEMPDGQRVNTGLYAFDSPKEARFELSKTLSKSKRLVAIVEKHQKPSGDIGKRVVAEFISEETGESDIGVSWLKKGGDSYNYIYAPTLEIALEFETYQESNTPRQSTVSLKPRTEKSIIYE